MRAKRESMGVLYSANKVHLCLLSVMQSNGETTVCQNEYLKWGTVVSIMNIAGGSLE